MKKYIKYILVFIAALIVAIIYGNFTYMMEAKYGNEALWTFIRFLPFALFVAYYFGKDKKQ